MVMVQGLPEGWLTQSLFDGGEFAIDAGAFAHVIPVRLLGW